MKTDFDKLTPEIEEICHLYDTIMLSYAQLNELDFPQAFKLATRSLALADNFNTLMANSAKLAVLRPDEKLSKTDLQKYFYGKYRVMCMTSEFCRVLWKVGCDSNRTGQR